MISKFQVIIALVILGLGALFYFIYRKSPEKPKDDDDTDPLENVKSKPVEPTPTATPVPVPTGPRPPDVFIGDKQYTFFEAKAKCASIGRRLCTDSEICESTGSTIFHKANGGIFGRMFRTWVGGDKEKACKDSGKDGAWRYIGTLAGEGCAYRRPGRDERCGEFPEQKLEGFACCGNSS